MAAKLRAQLLSELNRIKGILTTNKSPWDSPDLWVHHVEFQKVCSRLLIMFLEFSLEKGVEKDLWNVGFRQTINSLQTKSQDDKTLTEALNWYLNSASGFYLQFFHNICSHYHLNFAFHKKDSALGLMGGGLSEVHELQHTEKTTKLLMYLCQYCLIHLGDLSRYRHQAKQAEMFYRHAVSVSPTSGHPYNQLSLLEAGRGNKLGAVCLSMQAICVPAPFPVAPLNLSQTLTKTFSSRSDSNLEEAPEVCLDKHEYSRLFLELHYHLLIRGDVEKAEKLVTPLTTALSPLVATMSTTRSNLIQMCIICIFTHSYFSKKINLKSNSEDPDNRKEDNSFVNPESVSGVVELVEKLMVDILASLLLPIYTIKEPAAALVFLGLPAVLILLEWLLTEKNGRKLMQEQVQIWPGICSLANLLNKSLVDFDASSCKNKPLAEHWKLQCFQPFSKAISSYKFENDSRPLSVEESTLLRAHLIVEITKKYCAHQMTDGPIIKMVTQPDNSVTFETQAKPPVEDVLDLERLTLLPTTSGNASSKNKMGILKPRNSLEKSSKEDLKEEKTISVKIEAPESSRKQRKNVAMQAILKRNPSQEKQVTFKNVSPSPSPNPELKTPCKSDPIPGMHKLLPQGDTKRGSQFPNPPSLMSNVGLGSPNVMFERFPHLGGESVSNNGKMTKNWSAPPQVTYRQPTQNPPISLLGFAAPVDVEPGFSVPKRFDQPPPNWDKHALYNNTMAPGSTIPPTQPVIHGSISVPPPNVPPYPPIPSLFSRPPPPIKPSLDSVGGYCPANNIVPIPPLMPTRKEPYLAEGMQDGFRGNSSYSLFGPLGGTMDPPSASLSMTAQHMPSHSQKNISDRLWAGPSPLQRLLEQKKFSSTKNPSNSDHFK